MTDIGCGTLSDVLVSTDWLAEHVDDPVVRIVDIRGYVKTTDLGGGRQHADYVGAREEYDAGHVPGATYIDWTTDITDPDDPVKVQVAPPDRFAAAMSSRGIGDENAVVIVYHTGGHFATRLWWALRYYGHCCAAVLDGGMNKWTNEGRPLTTELPRPAPASFTPRLTPELRVEAGDVLAGLRDSENILLDARDIGQYRGDVRRGSRGGHIPGAVSVPAKSFANEDGTWRPLPDQRRLLAAAGIEADRPVIAYCNGGVTATGLLFALHRTGHRRYANYDGSWNEWGERPELPVQEGAPEE